MDIVYTFDDGYSTITAVSMVSLLENNKSVSDLNIHIVDCGISESNKLNFQKLCDNYDRKLNFVNGKDFEKRIPIKLDCLSWSFVCYVRLFFSELFPELDRILHIDCDTIVRNRIDDIFELNMDEYCCAACYDCIPSIKYATGFKKDDYYFSNGFLLFNLERMRKNNIQDQFINYIVEKSGKFPHLDQDVLNHVLEGKIKVLHPKYNLMTYTAVFESLSCDFFNNEPYYSKNEIKEALTNPFLVHFVGFKFISKPWAQPCYHPYNDEWIKYYEMIDFKNKEETIKYKRKKYGFIRELIVYFWNICHKNSLLNKLLFNIEKFNIRKKINKYSLR